MPKISVVVPVYGGETYLGECIESIPEAERQKYMRQITFLKLNGLFPIAYSHPESLIDKQLPYLKQIAADAKTCGYRLSLKEWLLLHSGSKEVLKLTGFGELAMRSLKYRLKG